MKPHEVNAFLAKQPGTTVRNLLDRWKDRAAKDAHFKKEWPDASAYAAAQLEQVNRMTKNPGNVRMSLPQAELGRIKAKAAALQAGMRAAA